jgi:DNA-binding GntR family transcriptional regulator
MRQSPDTAEVTFLHPVSHTSSIPLYTQVIEQIEDCVIRGLLKHNQLLPSEPELCKIFGASRATVRRAVDHLVKRGVIRRERGIGTRISREPRIDGSGLRSVYSQLMASNRKPTTDLLDLSVFTADEDASSSLGFPVGTPLARIKRLRRANGVPVSIMVSHIPRSVLDPSGADLVDSSLDELLRHTERPPHMASQKIEAVLPTPDQCRLLGLSEGRPFLSEEIQVFDVDGFLINHSRNFYNPDSYTFRSITVDSARGVLD